MTTWQKIVAAAMLMTALLVVWMGRYDMQAVPTGGEGSAAFAYILDRWTGTAHVLLPTFRRELKEPPPANYFDQFDTWDEFRKKQESK